MQPGILRSASVASCLAALAALGAGPAQAAVLAYTANATAVTAESATLNGSIVSGGAATPWEFHYGIANEPFTGTFSPTETIAADSAPSVAVLAAVTGLIPSTTYTFNLLASPGTPGSTTSPPSLSTGAPLTFTTKGAGYVSLTKAKLKVKRNRVSMTVRCHSTIACQGQVAITAHRRVGKKSTIVACGSAAFMVEPGTKKTFTTGRVSRTCKGLLGKAIDGVIDGHVQMVFTSYQKTVSKSVTLTLVH